MTKKTIVIWATEQSGTEHILACNAKLVPMVEAAQTDLTLTEVYFNADSFEVHRFWIDQAAAEDWASFLNDTNQSKADAVPTSITIEDYV